MNQEQLAIAKKIAEIEGIELLGPRKLNWRAVQGELCVPYNPFDWSILGPLMLKYEVFTDYNLLSDFNGFVKIGFSEGHWKECEFEYKSEIPMAILKCIIKSKE